MSIVDTLVSLDLSVQEKSRGVVGACAHGAAGGRDSDQGRDRRCGDAGPA